MRPLQFRGKARLLGPFTPHAGEVTASVFGFQFHLDLAEHIQRCVYMGTFEREETTAVREYLKPGMTFFDIGANIGYFTALGASLVGESGTVVAVEPSPVAFRKLDRMVATSGARNIHAYHVGLSDTPGELTLRLLKGSDNHTPTFVAQSSDESQYDRYRVPADTLDATAERLGIQQIDLIKIDVEGWEPHVFAGAARMLRERRIKAILTESNSFWLEKAGSSQEEYYSMLRNAGFRESPISTSPSHDGVLFVL